MAVNEIITIYYNKRNITIKKTFGTVNLETSKTWKMLVVYGISQRWTLSLVLWIYHL